MRRIRRGWALTKKSWALLSAHRDLVRFPLYGGIATIVLGLVFLGPGAFALDKHSYGIGVPLIVIGIYVLSVVGIYFSVGLAACADLIFRGQEAGVADGMALANSRFSQICGWAALSTAIAVVIGLLENQGGAIGDIAGRLVGAAWFSSRPMTRAIAVERAAQPQIAPRRWFATAMPSPTVAPSPRKMRSAQAARPTLK